MVFKKGYVPWNRGLSTFNEREYQRKYHRSHPEMVRKSYRRWFEANREKRNEYQRKYRQEHPEFYREAEKRHRLKYKNMISEYFGDCCWICGHNGSLYKHEINGENHEATHPSYYLKNIERFILLCRFCHVSFHTLMDFGYSFEDILKIFKWEVVEA
jgi:hypothetical protein